MAGAQGAGIVITVYGMSMSGNCYKLRLLLEQLGRFITLLLPTLVKAGE